MHLTISYMVGVYLGINAIRDAFLLVEGPDCTYLKTEFIQGNHDLMANLTSVSGFHRVTNTALHPAQMARSREEKISAMLEKLAAKDLVPALFMTSMPMAFITGADYERLCRGVKDQCGKPVIHIPGKSLSSDWMNGYAETLKAIARHLPLRRRSIPGPPRVGIVGYLFDRNEEDHNGNIRELHRMIQGIGAQVSSIWLSGDRFCALSEIETSDIIVSLPYARHAARRVARTLQVPLLELHYPFGLERTKQWLEAIGGALNLEAGTAHFIDTELGRIVPRLEWAIPSVFVHKKYGYAGDPVLVHGFKDIVELTGGTLQFACITALAANFSDGEQLGLSPENLFINPSTMLNLPETADLIVSNNNPYLATDTPAVEFGFPSYFTHRFYDRPFIGMNGFLAFSDTLMNALRRAEFHTIKYRQRS
jgi:nitrogenase molybdenum-iron protein alpha/beta subunit